MSSRITTLATGIPGQLTNPCLAPLTITLQNIKARLYALNQRISSSCRKNEQLKFEM